MNKYLQLLNISWQNGLVYRTSLFFWRFRQFLSSLMALTVWSVLYTSNSSQIFGYEQNQMITYIFLTAILHSIILATALHGLAQQIHSGEISVYLVKPVSLFGFFASAEVADKAKNLVFILIETAILFALFQPHIVLPTVPMLGLFLLWTLGGATIHFFITILFGTLGFWSPETWGPKFLFFIFVDFTAGRLFPLDIFPELIQRIVYLTPFPYFSFFQTQLFLNKLSAQDILIHSISLLGWIVALYFITRAIWNKGIRDYQAAGQ